jgi:hypothetical protein
MMNVRGAPAKAILRRNRAILAEFPATSICDHGEIEIPLPGRK